MRRKGCGTNKVQDKKETTNRFENKRMFLTDL